jgi:ATPase subunit of ABC transporter with duplicated ATPase domains
MYTDWSLPCWLQVDVLSGGEKARLALAKFMLTQGTFLVLDEPTNHLDIPSKEMLEEALMKFEGAVIAVSHDRYFLRKIATRVVTVSSAVYSCLRRTGWVLCALGVTLGVPCMHEHWGF